MKMAAKSLPEDEDDSWVEAEIERELKNLTIDLDALDDAVADEETGHNITTEDDILQKEVSNVVMPALDEYISKVNRQVEMMEMELRECDDVLHEVEIVTARQPQNDAFLEALAAEAGTDVHSLKQRILLELEAEEKAEKNWADVMDGSSDDVNNDVIVTLPTNHSHDAPQVEASTADPLKDSDIAKENGELPDNGASTLSDSASLVPAEAGETEAFNCEALENQLRLQLRELNRTQQHKEVERQQIEESLKEKENLLVKELAEERQKRLMKIEEEVSQLNEENQKREAKYVEEQEMMTKRMEKSLNESKLQIERLTDRVNEQREALKQMTDEKNLQEEQQRMTSATKIQAQFRGFRVRKIYGVKVKEKIEEVKELRKNDRLKVIEERIRMEEEKKREEERKRMEEEERKRKLEEEEKKRIEEEKQRKEEEVKRKKEEERLRKEEERRRKEEEKQRNKEEERKRKELEKLKKEEEKKKKEEETRKKEEDERKRKEERLKKEEEERVSREVEERRREEERKRKEEEQKQEEDKLKKHSENLIKNEGKDDRLGQIVIAKTNDVKERNSEQMKLGTAGATNTETNSKHEPTKAAAKDKMPATSQKIGSSFEESKLKPIEQQKPESTLGLAPSIRNVTESLPKASGVTETNTQPLKVEQNRKLNEKNKTCEVQENVSKSVEARRLAWMKENQSWSKSVSRQGSQKVVQSQNRLHVPSSAKNLPALDEKVVLLSSKAVRLNQVVAIELRNISACSLRSLSQCVHLKHLVMNNCNLVATEGLERVTSLQYVDLKNNKLEMMNFTDLVNLLFLDVSMNSLRSTSGLTGCKSLRYLNVSNNRITRISGLESLDRLHTFMASGNQMISTKGLADVTSVQVLDLSSNHLSIVDDLEHLGMLRVLNLQSNNLMTVPSLTNQVLLCDLLLDKNSLSSLTTLSKSWLPCLSHLGLSENRLTCLVDLRFCLCLQSLDLSNNLITDINNVSTQLVSCQRLESMNVEGNAVIEDSNYRSILLSTMKSLRYLNEEKPTDSASVPMSKEPDSWLATCLSHVDGYRNLHGDYVKSLQTADNSLSNIYDIHERYFASSHQMATQHRFFHEYGGKILPQPPVTPKLSAHEESNSGSLEKPPSIQESSSAQTMDMKAKFEQALLGTSSSRNTQPRMNAGSDQRELKNNLKTVDTRFSGEGSCDDKSEKTALLKNELDKSLAPKNLGLRHTSPAASGDVSQSSPEADGGYGRGGSISQLPQQPMNGSSMQTVITSNEIYRDWNQSKPYSGNVGYLDRAAVKIQSLWRGYSFRKRLQRILSDAHLSDDVTGDLDYDDFDIEALMPNDMCFDKDLVLPPTPRIPIDKVSPVGRNNFTNHVPTYVPVSNPDMEFPRFPKQAWRSNNTPSPLGELIPPRGLRPNPPGKPPLPPSSRLSNLTDAHSNTTTGHSIRQEKIMEEWDFKNPKTADLFLQRANRMNQLSRKKLTDLDPMKRLEIMRRLEETNKVPLATTSLRRERPQPRKEYFKAMREQEEQRDSQIKRERHQKAEYTFEWLHTQVQHCDAPLSLPQINPGSLGGKTAAALACRPSSHELHSADGASAANVGGKQRRLSFNSDILPPLSVTSKPSSAGELSWHRSEVNQSVGWGGGKKRAHQRR